MSKPLWILLLSLVGGMALFWSISAGRELLSYGRLGPEVAVQITAWDLVPKGSKYALRASYSYEYGGQKFTGQTEFPKPYHLNKRSAEKEIEQVGGMQWVGWVDARHPEVSSIDKQFPLKKVCYAALLVGIFLYFLYLHFHVELLTRSM